MKQSEFSSGGDENLVIAQANYIHNMKTTNAFRSILTILIIWYDKRFFVTELFSL